ncbi:hypothetical protein VB796_21410 [Arcicella sp. LKC2W]|uniref:hypothetical protein n=1 Tax=Arcicella sp. LKC2W TaxID=2984198 RepID=UPI002B1F2089|nr:hypothetical protein [Arcicella sp. LKC2W]MEA5461640.1 hypothetical protein [Arcicella sp. LKC2W]
MTLDTIIESLTVSIFFLAVFLVERKGVLSGIPTNHLQGRMNQYLYHNKWLYVLPYFYGIGIVGGWELETGRIVPTSQIVGFVLFILFQVCGLIYKQSQSPFEYVINLKIIFSKIHWQFFKTPPVNAEEEQKEAFITKKKAIRISFHEAVFFLNAFVLPLLFIIANAYFLTKIISLIKLKF